MNRYVLIGSGSALVVVGVYCPTAYYASGIEPGFRSEQTYFDDATGDSVCFFVLGYAMIVLAAVGMVRSLRWAAVATATLVVLALFDEWTPAQLLASIANGGAPSPSAVDEFVSRLHPSWGWIVLLSGAGLLLAGGLLREKMSGPGRSSEEPDRLRGFLRSRLRVLWPRLTRS